MTRSSECVYGSVPHKLIEEAIRKYHLPNKVQHLITEYYNKISVRFTVQEFAKNWKRLEKGIVTGSTVSVMLFVMAINLFVSSALKKC